MLKSNIIWPETRRYKSRTEWEPLGFFSECLCYSKQFDLMLGYFSSSAISVLSYSFAAFLYNGGKLRLIINDVLTEKDKDAFKKGIGTDLLCSFDLSDISSLQQTLSNRDKHFFECLSWLIRNNRIEFKIITPKGSDGISHTKTGVFFDGVNKVCFDGSCNFSRTALVSNIESLRVSCCWDGTIAIASIEDIENDINNVFKGNDENLSYKEIDFVKTQITQSFNNKDICELLNDEYKLLENEEELRFSISLEKVFSSVKTKISKMIKEAEEAKERELNEPHFPYPSGPRKYQIQAFENWKANKQKGLFAMATGTGKTLTSLNCLLEIYKRKGYYKAIILVPTKTLVDQWFDECRKFNFRKIIKVYSANSHWKEDIEELKIEEKMSSTASYIIISTYDSFKREVTFNELKGFSKSKTLLIADEAHNMGATGIMKRLKHIPYQRRIGLSATPDRQFDEKGNQSIADFFDVKENYTFKYDMKDAINDGFLCKYEYYPHLVQLTNEEMSEYVELSTKIAQIYSIVERTAEEEEILLALLLRRKRIIHKARNKNEIFRKIILERFKEKGNLKYTLVYVPEGNKSDYEDADYFDTPSFNEYDDSDHLIDQYTKIICDIDKKVTVKKFTGETKDRDIILSDFAEGKIQVLASMKCLDEGVDVPRSEMAIFCASTGNPRQFIQRRGRILRNHKDKHIAIIHDLIVAPAMNYDDATYELEKHLLDNELKRVRDFALLSENSNDSQKELEDILSYYGLSMFN